MHGTIWIGVDLLAAPTMCLLSFFSSRFATFRVTRKDLRVLILGLDIHQSLFLDDTSHQDGTIENLVCKSLASVHNFLGPDQREIAVSTERSSVSGTSASTCASRSRPFVYSSRAPYQYYTKAMESGIRYNQDKAFICKITECAKHGRTPQNQGQENSPITS